MLTKCNCNNCSAHLEFDSENAGQSIKCPTCGIGTTLYVPQLPPLPKIEKPFLKTSEVIEDPAFNRLTPAESIIRVRQDTCYRTLRSLVNVFEWVSFIYAGLFALGSIRNSVNMYAGLDVHLNPILGAFWRLTNHFEFVDNLVFDAHGIGGLFVAALIVLLAIAAKQASLLLIDIADCQIQSVKQ